MDGPSSLVALALIVGLAAKEFKSSFTPGDQRKPGLVTNGTSYGKLHAGQTFRATATYTSLARRVEFSPL